MVAVMLWPCGSGGFTPPLLTLIIAAAAIGAFLAEGGPHPALIYDRAAIGAGELWRLLAGHLAHADAGHLAWNVAAFLALGALIEMRPGGAGRLAGALAGGCAAASAWLWFAAPELARYCGLSGALNTLYVVLLADLWRRTGGWGCPLLIALDGAKICWEAASGEALFTATSWAPTPGAHAAGFAAGLAIAALARPPGKRPPRRRLSRPACGGAAGAAR